MKCKLFPKESIKNWLLKVKSSKQAHVKYDTVTAFKNPISKRFVLVCFV